MPITTNIVTTLVPSTGQVTLTSIKSAFGNKLGNALSGYRGKHLSVPANSSISFSSFRGVSAVAPSIDSLLAISGTNCAIDAAGTITGAVSTSKLGSLVVDIASLDTNASYNHQVTYTVSSGVLPAGATLSTAGVLTLSGVSSSYNATCTILAQNYYGNQLLIPIVFNLTTASLPAPPPPVFSLVFQSGNRKGLVSDGNSVLYPGSGGGVNGQLAYAGFTSQSPSSYMYSWNTNIPFNTNNNGATIVIYCQFVGKPQRQSCSVCYFAGYIHTMQVAYYIDDTDITFYFYIPTIVLGKIPYSSNWQVIALTYSCDATYLYINVYADNVFKSSYTVPRSGGQYYPMYKSGIGIENLTAVTLGDSLVSYSGGMTGNIAGVALYDYTLNSSQLSYITNYFLNLTPSNYVAL